MIPGSHLRHTQLSETKEPEMSDEIELISDGDGLAVVGEEGAVDRFIGTLMSIDASRPITLGASAANASAMVATQSGRWVKLTAESAAKVKKYGLTPTKTPGVSHAMVGAPGKIKNWVQIDGGAVAKLTNPAALANAGAIMSQLAMQQQLDAIADYLEIIDQKLDSVLRTQVNQVLSRLDGVDLTIREGLAVREAVGRVSEVTWSKLQSSAQTVHEVQGFAIRQLGELAERINAKRVHELLDLVTAAEADVKKWLLVLARCFELLEQVGILELDRVLDSSPDELDRHRIGLQSARADRIAVIRDATERMLVRIAAAIEAANSRVLLNPIQSPAIVTTSERIAIDISALRSALGIDAQQNDITLRRWRDAAGENLERLRDTSSVGLDKAKKSGGTALDSARQAKGKLAGRIADRRRPADSSALEDE